MAARIAWNKSRGSITSAFWKMIERPWRTILAEIFTSRLRSVVKPRHLRPQRQVRRKVLVQIGGNEGGRRFGACVDIG
jgi:hypothetical protein